MDKHILAMRLVEVIDDRAQAEARREIEHTAITTRDMIKCVVDCKHDTVVEVLVELFRCLSPGSLETVVEHFKLDYPGRPKANDATRSRTG